MVQAVKNEVQWANPGALGLAGFGFCTISLQIHNIGLIDSTLPLVFGFFWGGIAQLIAGIIDARRGDTFGLTAFVSYGLFWMGLGFAFLLQWFGLVTLDGHGLAWLCICWGVFTGYMTIGTFKISYAHVSIFTTLTILFFLLAAHFFGTLPAVVPGIEGLLCGTLAVYTSIAVVLDAEYGRWILPIGLVA